MKTIKTLFNFMKISKAVVIALIFLCMTFYGQAIKAGNHDPKVNNLIVKESPPSKPELILVPYEYSNGYNVSCTGFSDGSIDLTVTGGVPPYSYKWSNEEVTEDIYNLAIGYYKVTVVDAANQVVWAEITLTGPNPDSEPKISSTVSSYPNGYNVSCYSCFNGSIDLTVTGGTGVYTYRWDKDSVTTQDRTGLGGGNYGVTIRDASACGNNKEYHINVELTQPERKDLWTMNGNANTNPGTQFIGTTDNKEMIFKTNDSLRLKINANGNVGIGTTNAMEKLTVGGNMNVQGILKSDSLAGEGFKFDSLSTKSLKLVFADENGNLTSKSNISRDINGGPCTTNRRFFPWFLGGNLMPTSIPYGVEEADWIGSCNNYPFMMRTNGIERMRIDPNGNVGIGTMSPQAKLQINMNDNTDAFSIFNSNDNNYNFKVKGDGFVFAREVTVTLNTFPDFVFVKNYNLTPLTELEKYITIHKHLPDMPTADDVAKNGLLLGQTQALLLQKIEELTLYVIELNKQIQDLKKENSKINSKSTE